MFESPTSYNFPLFEISDCVSFMFSLLPAKICCTRYNPYPLETGKNIDNRKSQT